MIIWNNDFLMVHHQYYVERVSQTYKVLASYSPGGTDVFGAIMDKVCLQNKMLHMIFQLILILTHNYHKVNILLQPDTLIYAECSRGKISAYNLTSGNKAIKVAGLKCPYSLAKYTNSSITFYFVSEFQNQGIWVFDITWTLMYTIAIPGKPRRIVVSPASTLWVCETYFNRVSEFAFDGTWIRHVVSGRDGIKKPWDISYHPKHPQFLWVSYYMQDVKKYYIKRFRATDV